MILLHKNSKKNTISHINNFLYSIFSLIIINSRQYTYISRKKERRSALTAKSRIAYVHKHEKEDNIHSTKQIEWNFEIGHSPSLILAIFPMILVDGCCASKLARIQRKKKSEHDAKTIPVGQRPFVIHTRANANSFISLTNTTERNSVCYVVGI